MMFLILAGKRKEKAENPAAISHVELSLYRKSRINEMTPSWNVTAATSPKADAFLRKRAAISAKVDMHEVYRVSGETVSHFPSKVSLSVNP